MDEGKRHIKIAGAGISGLTAAINLVKEGYEVTVYEVNSYPGGRFKGDWQHLENWTNKENIDILCYLKSLGLEINFTYKPCRRFSLYTPSFKEVELKSELPIFYSVRRGKPKDSIDYDLYRQAKELGVKVLFRRKITNEEVDILATGPGKSRCYVAGINFDSEEKDRIFVLVDKNLSYTYAYFSIIDGKGTLASTHEEPRKAHENLRKFQKRINDILSISMEHGEFFMARANVSFVKILKRGNAFYVGEAAGFQDSFTGFGMVTAVKSGYIAARSIIEGLDYEESYKAEILPLMRASYMNLSIIRAMPNFMIDYLAPVAIKMRSDSRELLRIVYNGSILHKLLFPFLWQGGEAIRKIKS